MYDSTIFGNIHDCDMVGIKKLASLTLTSPSKFRYRNTFGVVIILKRLKSFSKRLEDVRNTEFYFLWININKSAQYRFVL